MDLKTVRKEVKKNLETNQETKNELKSKYFRSPAEVTEWANTHDVYVISVSSYREIIWGMRLVVFYKDVFPKV